MNVSKIYQSNQEFECGIAKAQLNIYNGKLALECPLLSLGAKNFKLDTLLVYNSYYSDTNFNGKKIGFGNGWKLNIHQYVFPYLIDYDIDGFQVGDYVYIDDKWNIHKFVKYRNSTTYGTPYDCYYDSDGTGLKLLVGKDVNTQMFDIYNNTYIFDNDGRMIKIISALNSEISKQIEYREDNLVSFYDERKKYRKINFLYNLDNTVDKIFNSVNSIGYQLIYDGKKLNNIIKYSLNTQKDMLKVTYNELEKIDFVINSNDLNALQFHYVPFKNELSVNKIRIGRMKKNILKDTSNSELFAGEQIYLVEGDYITGTSNKYKGYLLSLPDKYIRDEITMDYNNCYTQVTNKQNISFRYYFNNDGKTISTLEVKNDELYNLKRENGWELSVNGDSSLKFNGENINIITDKNNFTYYVDAVKLDQFKSIFLDLNGDGKKDEEFSEHFNISFWLNFTNNIKSNMIMKLKLKYTINDYDTTKIVKFEKTEIGAWQQIVIPVNLGLNQILLESISLIFEDCDDDTIIQITNVSISKGSAPEIYICNGTGDSYKELKLEIGTKLYYYTNGVESEQTISPDFYMTENDIFLTYKSLFYKKKNNETYFDLVYNNGTCIKSVLYVGIKNENNNCFGFSINELDIPNYYFKLVDIINDGSWTIMEKQLCFHYDEQIQKYYYETKNMFSVVKNRDDLYKKLSDNGSYITYEWENADGTFRAKKDTAKVITEYFYDNFGNKVAVRVLKENSLDDPINITYNYYSDITREREEPDYCCKNGKSIIYEYVDDTNLIKKIICDTNLIEYCYDYFYEMVEQIKVKDTNGILKEKVYTLNKYDNNKLKSIITDTNNVYGFKYDIFSKLNKVFLNKKELLSVKSNTIDDGVEVVESLNQVCNGKIELKTTYDTYGKVVKQENNNLEVSFLYEDIISKSEFLKRIKSINDKFANEIIEYFYIDNENVTVQQFKIDNKINLSQYSNNSIEYNLSDDNQKYRLSYSNDNPLDSRISNLKYEINENNTSFVSLDDFNYDYYYDDCGRIERRQGKNTIYENCDSCGSNTGIQVSKLMTYHEGSEMPKATTYKIVSTKRHGKNDEVEFYYENSRYDLKGNIINISEGGQRYIENPKDDDLRDKEFLPTRNYTYDYDSFNRLSSENNLVFGNLRYEYDINCGMLEKIIKNDNVIKQFEYNVGRLTKVNNHGKIKQIAYDNYGNMLNNEKATFRYNSRNLMESYEFNDRDESPYYIHSYRLNYTYNYKGLRTQKIFIEEVTSMSPQVKIVNYFLNNNTILGEDWVDTNGKITQKIRYFYDLNGICGIRYDGYNFNLVKDSLGNVSKVMYKGKVIGEYVYDAWGNCIVNELSIANSRDRFVLYNNPFRYKGYYCDLESGLYYCNTRYYDPSLCLWLTPDKIKFMDFEKNTGANLYCYCYCNPIMYVDPNGQLATWIVVLIILGASTILGAIDGGISAAISEQNFWIGFGAGAISGLIGGVLGLVLNKLGPWGIIIARGVSSAAYDVLNEWFQTGTVCTNNLGLYAVDVMMDIVYSMLYAGGLNDLSNKGTVWKIISSALGGFIDSSIDIVQTAIFFSPNARERIRKMSSSNNDIEVSLSFEKVMSSSKGNLGVLSFM